MSQGLEDLGINFVPVDEGHVQSGNLYNSWGLGVGAFSTQAGNHPSCIYITVTNQEER